MDDYAGLDFSKSTDGGSTFSTPIFVAGSSAFQEMPAVATYGENNVYVVWEENYKIYYARSTNGGDSFEAKVQVSDAGADWDGPDIAVDSTGVIYVVWDGDDYIYIDKSMDGVSFGTDVTVNPSSAVVSNPSIAIDSNDNILVAWQSSYHVFFAESTDGGSTFTVPVQIDDSDMGAYNPSIGVEADGEIYVAWQDIRETYKDIYVAVSSDGGVSFSAGVKVNDDTTDTDQRNPSLAVHPCGKVFVAWQDARSGSSEEIYFAKSTDGGVSFGVNAKVSDAAPATYPSLAVGDDTEVYVVWTGSTGLGPIYFDQAPDATWPNAVTNLSVVDATTDSLTINWTAPGDNFALGTATTYDIRYSTSTITDANWDSATQVTTLPAPQTGGSVETFIVTGLNNDTTYYFALKTADEMPNWSPLSNVASGKTLDDWAPDAVTDLAASDPTSNSITLTWTAPGDNGNIGTATEYDIRYSESEINDANWADATNCTGEPSPSIAGTTETFVVTDLSTGTSYYFALKTADEVPNPSLLSNVVTESTTTNTPPVASNLVITPTAPKTADNLVGIYVYFDAETDAQSGTEIRWYKDDVLQIAYNDILTIPSTATAKGQVWYFTVKPNDGIEFGVLVTSPSVTILNSVPVTNFTVSPAAPYYRDAVITFNASVSTDPDAVDIVNYTWNVSGEIKYGL
ncbi:MAG: fibronectin type III domain-containing protein, partial [Thermoplasmatales archaeon]|nr:fibronectin type III domain-containing protein [Thermoplasmatales archaeon]